MSNDDYGLIKIAELEQQATKRAWRRVFWAVVTAVIWIAVIAYLLGMVFPNEQLQRSLVRGALEMSLATETFWRGVYLTAGAMFTSTVGGWVLLFVAIGIGICIGIGIGYKWGWGNGRECPKMIIKTGPVTRVFKMNMSKNVRA